MPPIERPIAPEPDPHRAAKLDLARPGADGLALQEKQNETGIAAVGQAEAFLVAVHAGLQDQGEVMALAPPGRALSAACAAGCQGEAAVGEAHASRRRR